jgi:hypothetical protein
MPAPVAPLPLPLAVPPAFAHAVLGQLQHQVAAASMLPLSLTAGSLMAGQIPTPVATSCAASTVEADAAASHPAAVSQHNPTLWAAAGLIPDAVRALAAVLIMGCQAHKRLVPRQRLSTATAPVSGGMGRHAHGAF